MGTYEFKRKRCAFQISLPDDFRSLQRESIARLHDVIRTSYYRSFLGSNSEHLNIMKLHGQKKGSEPTIKQTDRYFYNWTYENDMHAIATGIVNVADKEHFWGIYSQTILLKEATRTWRTDFYKKYCLILNKVQCLLTAKLYSDEFYSDRYHWAKPNDQMLQDKQKVYDEIALSLRLL